MDTSRYRRYESPGERDRVPAVYGKPRPGHGTVYLMPHPDGTWSASWQDNYPEPAPDGARAGIEDLDDVDKGTALEWARSRHAAHHLVFSPAADDYVPLTAESDPEGW